MSVRADTSSEAIFRDTGVPSHTSFTIASWFRLRGTGGTAKSILSLTNTDVSAQCSLFYRTASLNNPTLRTAVGDYPITGFSFVINTWYYVAVGSSGVGATDSTIWVIEENETVRTVDGQTSSFTPTTLSLFNNAIGQFTNSNLYNTMVWNTKLTTAELLQQMKVLSPIVQYSNLYSHAELNVHTSLIDLSGNGRDWTPTGALSTEANNPSGLTGLNLDLVPYTIVVNSSNLVEEESSVISLDLVTYSSAINDITVLENVVISLDLLTYSTEINTITILENEVVLLDLVSYSYGVNDLSIVENEIISLELLSFTASINDLTVLEHETVPLDLVTYTNTLYDITLLESGAIGMDIVTFSTTINDISIIESEIVPLDSAQYTSVVNPLSIFENDIIALDMVAFSSNINSVSMSNDDISSLDLILYSSNYLPIVLSSEEFLSTPPLERIYAIVKESRLIAIEIEDRIYPVEEEKRIIPII